MNGQRPDPDELLARVQAEESEQARGKLKVFFGAAPGVGKTYAMLEAARREARLGLDVVVGYVEPHLRPETQALTLGLEILRRRSCDYRGAKLLEFDLEAALDRRPRLIVVDELAHTNAPGVTHVKRWQDVEQLCKAGIDVYTTLNVQHLESLNDVCAQITGVRVQETIPDSVFDLAHEVELVDLPPDDLIERLREGKVYVPEQAERAIDHFFRKENLYALRELALRRTAERVNAQLNDYRRERAISDVAPTTDKLLVCVSPSPLSSRLVRAARRMAAGLRCPWVAVHIETPTDSELSPEARDRLLENLALAEQLGAQIATLSGSSAVEEIIAYARAQHVSKIVVGKPREPRWKEWIFGSLVYDLTRRCDDIDVYVISGDSEASRSQPQVVASSPRPLLPYVLATAVVALCTGAGWLVAQRFSPVNVVMLYLLGVVFVSLRYGPGPTILGVMAFDFFFVPPILTFAVDDTQYLVTFGVMLGTGLTISTLTSRLQGQARLSRHREQRTAALYSLSRDLAAVRSLNEIVQAVVGHVGESFAAQVVVFLPGPDSRLTHFGATSLWQPSERDQGVARWTFDHRDKAGLGTGTLPGADALYLPLVGSTGIVGVLATRPDQATRFLDPEQVRLLDAFCGQTAAAIERLNLARDAERTKLDVETERLRNALLSAVSHDLRTPLAAISGASSTLLTDASAITPDSRRELLQTIYDESGSLNRLVGNLLDTTRIEAGALRLNRDWQSLEELVGVVRDRLEAQLKSHPVSTQLPADLPLVLADGVLLQQALLNLLENAAKYSPAGSPIEINACVSPGEILVEIADRGRGLVPGEEEIIFDKFHRSAQAVDRFGAGLGLTVCKGIVQLHGGRIWAENRPGGGSVFRFTLPVGKAPEIQPEPPGEFASEPAGESQPEV